MTAHLPALRLRTVSPTLTRARIAVAPLADRSVRRRLGVIWGLLLFNVLGFVAGVPTLLPISKVIATGLTEGALALSLLLALSLNRQCLIRPNPFLALFTLLCLTTMIMSVDQYFGVGSIFRAGRLIVFVAVLWLTSPWWGRSDYLLARIHWRAMFIVLGSVIVGLAIAPGRSFAQAGGGRLGGTLWPITTTSVAHLAAIFTGLTLVMWFSQQLKSSWTGIAILGGVTILILTHTRTALIGLLLGVLMAALSLFVTRKRVRKSLAVSLVVVALGALSFAPFLNHWFDRGQGTQAIANLSGRSTVWSQLLAAPRSDVHILFGYGMSNDAFNGLPIDSSWLSTYDDQGLVGDLLLGSAFLVLLILALIAPRGPGRAFALFLIGYCLVSSYTETGLGDASSYILDLTVAMSVLMAPLVSINAALR